MTQPRGPFTAAEREFIVSAIAKNHGLTRAEAELIFERDRPAKRNPLLEQQWVHNLHHLCDALREGRARPGGLFASAFWIRLYGVITELLGRFRKTADAEPRSDKSSLVYRYFAASKEVFDACEAVKDSLSDDELVCLALLRQTYAHIYQDGFEYQIERGNPAKNQRATIRRKQMVKTVGRHVHVDAAHETLDRVYRRYGFDDQRVAVNFAHKVGAAVNRLDRAMTRLEGVRREDAELANQPSQPAGAPRPRRAPGR
jgi:hypothetical protein